MVGPSQCELRERCVYVAMLLRAPSSGGHPLCEYVPGAKLLWRQLEAPVIGRTRDRLHGVRMLVHARQTGGAARDMPCMIYACVVLPLAKARPTLGRSLWRCDVWRASLSALRPFSVLMLLMYRIQFGSETPSATLPFQGEAPGGNIQRAFSFPSHSEQLSSSSSRRPPSVSSGLQGVTTVER